MTTIVSPLRHFTGRTNIGGGVFLDFEDGVATYDEELPNGVRQYLLQAGYGIDGPPAEAAVEPAEHAPQVVDSRDVDVEQFGSTLRDAAVDPQDGDFLPPDGAGQGDPHGPDVVSPGIHANEDARPLKGKRVGTATQQDSEEAAHSRRTPRSR